MKTYLKLIFFSLGIFSLFSAGDLSAQTRLYITELQLTAPDNSSSNYEAEVFVYAAGSDSLIACAGFHSGLSDCGAISKNKLITIGYQYGGFYSVKAYFTKMDSTILDFNEIADQDIYFKVFENRDTLRSPWNVPMAPDVLLGTSPVMRGNELDPSKIMQFGNVDYIRIGKVIERTPQPNSPLIKVKEIMVTGVTDGWGNLEVEVHLYDDFTGEYLGSAGQTNGLGGVNVSGRLYHVDAEFKKPFKGPNITFEDVRNRTIYAVIKEDDSLPCPCPNDLPPLPDDIIARTEPFPGASLQNGLVFQNISKLAHLAMNLEGAPGRPLLSEPENFSVIDAATIDFLWQPGGQNPVDSYQFQIASDSAMSGIIMDTAATATQFSLFAPGTLDAGVYWWRVRGKNNIGSGFYSYPNVFIYTGASEIPRLVRLVDAFGNPGTAVEMPVLLSAQGDENAIGFSLIFDPAVLGSPQVRLGADAAAAQLLINDSEVTNGRLGVAIALSTGQTFTADTLEVAVVSFMFAENSAVDSARVLFGDQPVVREVTDVNALELPVTWYGGTISIFRGFEADVAPRPSGNGTLSVSDWVQAGRFAAGLDMVRTDVNEFQRADCAPRTSFGDGRLSISDWVQAGRYAAGLDPVVAAQGPFGNGAVQQFAAAGSKNLSSSGTHTVRAIANSFTAGNHDTLMIELEARGDENALGFSLSFDPNILTYDTTVVAQGISDAALIINPRQKENGKLGIALALPAGQKFASGTHKTVMVSFAVSENAAMQTTRIDFGDAPTGRELVDGNANIVATTWQPVSVTVSAATAVNDFDGTVPTQFALEQNFPNPFNPSTAIRFQLPKSSRVRLSVYNLNGQLVRTLVDAQQAAGRHEVEWDGNNERGERLPSGVYFYRIEAGEFRAVRKLVMVK